MSNLIEQPAIKLDADLTVIPKDPHVRVLECENEIMEVLKKHGCILVIRVAARADDQPFKID
jgi:hypothetical protein